MLESSSGCIGLKCAWNGISKDERNEKNSDQSMIEEQSFLLSGPYGDDVAFLKQFNDQIIIGLSDGVSGNRHHGLDPYKFAHTLVMSLIEESDRINGSSSMRGLVHRAIRSVEKRSIYGSATLCLLSIDRRCSSIRSLNIGDSGFMLIRNEKLLKRSHPQYHRGSSPFQISSLPKTQTFYSNSTRLYHDKPSDGEYFEERLQIGDIILIASDGLFDNLYEDFIVQIVNNHHLDEQSSVESLQNACEMVVQSAYHAGIKRDDILVLILVVIPCSPQTIVERNVKNKSASCSSSDCSLSCLLIDQDEQQSFDLFIFEN